MYVIAEIQQLVLSGQISEALRLVYSSYPGLLETRKELLFRLKCQQFVEMLVGNDSKELYEQTSSPTTSLHSPAPSLHSPVSHSPTPPLQSPSVTPLRTAMHSRSSLSVTNGTASNGLVHTNGVESEDSEAEEDTMEVEHHSPLCSPHSDCGEYPDSILFSLLIVMSLQM